MDFELSQQQIMFRDMARKFAEQEIIPTLKDYERRDKCDTEIYKKLASLGLLGINLPEKYGGLDLDCTTMAIIMEQLSWGSFAVTSSVCGGPGPTVLLTAGTEEQKQKYLPAQCKGEKIIVMAVNEPNAGSDIAGMETTAVPKGDRWVINGNKIFIGNAGIADMVIVAAKTDKGSGARGISMFIVDKGTPGLSITNIPGMLSPRTGDVGEIRFTDCTVPRENLVGEIGRGLKSAMNGIGNARLGISAGCLGISQSCLEACLKYTKERHQFGKPLASFQLVQGVIAEMAIQVEAARWLVYRCADLRTRGVSHTKELSYAKYFTTELAIKVSAEAIKLHGAYGLVDDYLLEHHYRDAIMSTMVGGTPNMHKLIIGRELLGIDAVR